MEEQTHNGVQALEAVLFIYGEAISRKKLAQLLKMELGQVNDLVAVYQQKLSADDRGLTLLISEESIQLATKPEFSGLLESLAKEEFSEELTKATLETLAIVAYLGPISRPEIDYIRGVNSSFILRSLLLRKLVERNPDPERPMVSQYAASFDALRHMGITKAEDLPDFEKYRELLKMVRKSSGQTPEPAKEQSHE